MNDADYFKTLHNFMVLRGSSTTFMEFEILLYEQLSNYLSTQAQLRELMLLREIEKYERPDEDIDP